MAANQLFLLCLEELAVSSSFRGSATLIRKDHPIRVIFEVPPTVFEHRPLPGIGNLDKKRSPNTSDL
ncbi:MAG: hypothetical protein WCG34_04870, partial [Leptolinea sp.]